MKQAKKNTRQKSTGLLKEVGIILFIKKVFAFTKDFYDFSSQMHKEICRKIKLYFSSRNSRKMENKFTQIFNKNLFLGKESVSGTGSDLTQTQIIRSELPKLLKKLNAQIFIDAPCGDFYWMKYVDLENIDYIGLDIVEKIISTNKKLYGNNRRKFIRKNIVSDLLPGADVILIRDCLVHLDTESIFKTIINLKKSNITYLLTTSFPKLDFNKELTQIWRPLNLQIAPYNFPKPLAIINEGCTENDGKYSDKSLILWDVSALPNFVIK